jgi:hypothetical protein
MFHNVLGLFIAKNKFWAKKNTVCLAKNPLALLDEIGIDASSAVPSAREL